jgi:16S rRNA U516 pseudouridylate synthase RsuA-like enzyme
MEVRVQKFLSEAGLASRRKAEEFIKSKQVQINGKVAKLGDR